MNKLGTVAVYIKSESCDSYLYCFENKSIDHIWLELSSNIEMFEPISDWMTDGGNEDFVSEVDTLMYKLYEKSWE